MTSSPEFTRALNDLLPDAAHIHYIYTIHLMDKMHITPAWHLQHTVSDKIVHLDHLVSDLRAVYRVLQLQHPDTHFWMDYIGALCTAPGDIRTQLFKTSADCGNPYAAYEYALILMETAKQAHVDPDDAVLLHYLQPAADIGHCDAVCELLHTLTQTDTAAGYCALLHDPLKQHAFIAQLMRYVPTLRRALDRNYNITLKHKCGSWLYDIYDTAHERSYPQPVDEPPWSVQRYEYVRYTDSAGYDMYIMRGHANSLYTEYRQLWNTVMDLRADVLRLQMLNSMSLDEVCKDVVKGYCIVRKID